MDRWRLGDLVYRWEDLVKVPVEPEAAYEEEGFGPTITVPFKLLG